MAKDKSNTVDVVQLDTENIQQPRLDINVSEETVVNKSVAANNSNHSSIFISRDMKAPLRLGNHDGAKSGKGTAYVHFLVPSTQNSAPGAVQVGQHQLTSRQTISASSNHATEAIREQQSSTVLSSQCKQSAGKRMVNAQRDDSTLCYLSPAARLLGSKQLYGTASVAADASVATMTTPSSPDKKSNTVVVKKEDDDAAAPVDPLGSACLPAKTQLPQSLQSTGGGNLVKVPLRILPKPDTGSCVGIVPSPPPASSVGGGSASLPLLAQQTRKPKEVKRLTKHGYFVGRRKKICKVCGHHVSLHSHTWAGRGKLVCRNKELNGGGSGGVFGGGGGGPPYVN